MTIRETGRARLLRAAASAWADVPNLLSLLVFFTITAVLFRSMEFALVVTASLGFHELGHAAALSWLGLDFHIRFGVIGAWTWSRGEERAQLPQFKNAAIHLAGPFFSLLLALAALALNAVWQPESDHLLVLANFSVQVGFLNLLPVGSLTDGGKAVRRMIASLPRGLRQWAVFLPFAITAIGLTVFTVIEYPWSATGNAFSFILGLLLVGIWLAGSLIIDTHRITRKSHIQGGGTIPAPGRPMKPGQVYLLIFLIWDLLVLMLVIMAATPFWLTPEYLLGYLRNLEDLARLLAVMIGASM